MISPLQLALLGGALALVGSAGAGLAYLHLRAEREELARRIESVTESHMRARPLASAAITRHMAKEPEPLQRRAALLFGYDPAFREAKMPWYVVMPITFLLAIIGAEMTEAIFGTLRLLLVVPLWVMLSRFFWNWRRDKRLTGLLLQFPDALAMIVRSVRVGIPVSEAIRVVARESPMPTAKYFDELSNELSIGVALEAALPKMAEHTHLPEYRFFATAISLQTQTGGALSETLENLADVIRKRVALRARGKALSSEARASAGVLAALPFVTGGALCFLNPSYMAMLISDPSGRKALGLAVVLLSGGILSMRTIIRKVLS